jgi:hypothetical protein
MKLTNYLKEQLTDFVEVYRKCFFRTYGVTITFTIICFLSAAILLRYSYFDKSLIRKQISLLSYFFHRYSKAKTYSIIDLTKSLFIFFVSLYSLGLIRLKNYKEEQGKKLSFKHFFSNIKLNDFLALILTLFITAIIDYILFKIDSYSILNIQNINAAVYIHELLFHLNIYLPLILFAITIRLLTTEKKSKLTFKRILFLYISLWLFNEFAFEFSLWIENHLFGLILMPFADSEKYYLFESFIAIPLIAFYFLGYYSAMTTSLILTEPPT